MAGKDEDENEAEDPRPRASVFRLSHFGLVPESLPANFTSFGALPTAEAQRNQGPRSQGSRAREHHQANHTKPTSLHLRLLLLCHCSLV